MFQSNAFPYLLLFLFTGGASCTKKPNDPPLQQQQGIVTQQPKGTPVGENYTEMIGSAGGTVTSADGLLEIEIPPGALTNDTEIGIQPLRHTATRPVGKSYRLTPHGHNFKKSVTVRFKYWKYNGNLGSALAPEIAFQKDSGEWVCTGKTTKDTITKTISVQTDHFSDWALIASMELSPVTKTLGAGKTVTLKALRYVFPDVGDWLAPLSLPNAGTGQPMLIEKQYIVKWTLHGPGKLETKGSEAVYTAPASAPAHSTATISVELNVFGKQALLISTINIVTEGIHISIDGGEWQSYPGRAVKMDELFRFSMSNIRSSEDMPQIVFQWPENDKMKSDGMHFWSMYDEDRTDVNFEYDEPDFRRMWISIFDDGLRTFDSAGFLHVAETEENGTKYISGTFFIGKAGLLDRENGQQIKTGNINGTFKVQRHW
ncbi:hypothetical protein [Chitinophaga rhizosphaerae]|uniref:hypothetical protein n=1 Tax=Chitinophaga rhizosphaerae TaxID=1864947 RepID=UPI000F8056A9|nr:hypothetical protein [Chitinophaga rhizosphaerae]